MVFLREQHIEYEEIIGKKAECGVPAPGGERYRASGMGKSKVNVEQKQASFYGYSEDYDIGIDPEHMDSIKKFAPDWEIEHS